MQNSKDPANVYWRKTQYYYLSTIILQSTDPVKILTVRTTAFEADESKGDSVSETKLDAPGMEWYFATVLFW